MSKFTSITVIYNPNSTGNGKQLALKLQKNLKKRNYKSTVEIIPTEYAGHATLIAQEKAKSSKRALVISASGDGGYNEVINGLMKAISKGAKPVAGVLPAGNANDYFHNAQNKNVKRSILDQKTKQVDLLKIESKSNKKPLKLYAHSYIGFGLTPEVGKELNKTKLNRINEVAITLKTILFLRSTAVKEKGEVREYYSVVMSNLKSMSKVVKLSKNSSIHDGKFELITFEKSSKWLLIKLLLKSITVGLKNETRLSKYEFKTINPIMVQVDGEVHDLDGNSKAKVSIVDNAIECLS